MADAKIEKMANVISTQLELKNGFSEKFVKEALRAIIKFDEKHTEKGLGEYTEFGALGVIIEMSKKYKRLKSAYKENKKEDVERLLQDWEDVAVYSLMGKLVEEGEWKEE